MKKTLLIAAAFILLSGLSLRAYFALTPPPEATLMEPLAQIVPRTLEGWSIRDLDMAESPESSARISDFLNFDDALFRVFERGDTFVGLYVAYWTPGKASYRWAGAHTPDTCWVLNGWTCVEREYSIPFYNQETPFQPAEFGVYTRDGSAQNVYFWHLVGGEAFGYEQQGRPNIFAALIDIQKHGLNLREEQFFIRLSSNKSLEELKKTGGFHEILDSLAEIGLAKNAG
ncbi:MAG: exosortase-associated EpsI family protein [Puniceicoccaceae bacterium]|nr:MAG: exosortase-associated EpsI family protein [Puniceicoccaceae bacterium]